MKQTYTKTIATKLFVFMLGFAMLFSAALPASTARAATIDDLQTQINTLLAQIAVLQAQLQGSASSNVACPYTWTRSLSIGATGADVMRLQQFLNGSADTQVAFSGVGSKGMETQYYGPLTAAAVSKFQMKYRSDVLTPLGLVNPTGYFGPSSIAKANMLCKTVVVVPPTNNDDDDSDDSPSEENKNEAYLRNFKVASGDDTNLEENQQDARIMDVEFDVEDGDVTINRVDVAFTHVLGDEDDPWDTFESVSIWVGSKKVAEVDTDNRSDWSDIDSDTYRLRISGLDIDVDQADTAEFSVGVTLANGIDGTDTGVSWDVYIPDEGIRVRDELNLTQYIGSDSDIVNIDINEEGSEDELAVRSSDDDPEATTLKLEQSGNSDWMTVFAFDLDTDDSENDIIINELPVALTVSTGTVNTFMRDVRVKIGNKTFDDVTITDGATNNMVFDFDDNDFVIDAGDRVTVEVQVEFKALAALYEGTTIQGSASATNIDAEGADDLEANQLSGSATGDLHVLRTKGAVIDLTSTSQTLKTNVANDISDDEGIFTIKFDVTAFESDLYINRTAATGTTLGTAGVNYLMEDSVGNAVSTGNTSASLSSNASLSGNRYRVPEGSTKTFTLTVVYDPASSGFYRLQLYSFNSATTNADPTIQQKTVPESRYETDPLSI